MSSNCVVFSTWKQLHVLSSNDVVSCNSLRLCLTNHYAFVFLRHYVDSFAECVAKLLPDNRRSATLQVEGCDPSGGWCREPVAGTIAVLPSTASVSIADADYQRLLQLASEGWMANDL